MGWGHLIYKYKCFGEGCTPWNSLVVAAFLFPRDAFQQVIITNDHNDVSISNVVLLNSLSAVPPFCLALINFFSIYACKMTSYFISFTSNCKRILFVSRPKKTQMTPIKRSMKVGRSTSHRKIAGSIPALPSQVSKFPWARH